MHLTAHSILPALQLWQLLLAHPHRKCHPCLASCCTICSGCTCRRARERPPHSFCRNHYSVCAPSHSGTLQAWLYQQTVNQSTPPKPAGQLNSCGKVGSWYWCACTTQGTLCACYGYSWWRWCFGGLTPSPPGRLSTPTPVDSSHRRDFPPLGACSRRCSRRSGSLFLAHLLCKFRTSRNDIFPSLNTYHRTACISSNSRGWSLHGSLDTFLTWVVGAGNGCIWRV